MKKGYVVNPYGIAVKRACFSCAFKRVIESITSRYCDKHHERVKPRQICKDWEMSETLRNLNIKRVTNKIKI